LPTFLGGIQLKAFYLTNVPPIFGKKIFTIPWTTTDAFGFPIGFFHSFPFSKGEISTPLSESHQKSSPPFEREDGRDFWESFFKGLNRYQFLVPDKDQNGSEDAGDKQAKILPDRQGKRSRGTYERPNERDHQKISWDEFMGHQQQPERKNSSRAGKTERGVSGIDMAEKMTQERVNNKGV